MANKFGFGNVLKNFDRLKQTLPPLLANQAQNFFVDSWKKQGWDNGSVQAWKPRQDKGKKSQGRAILVKSGKLRRAVGQSIRTQTFDEIKLVVALPYAAVHNDGYEGPVKAHSRDTFNKITTTAATGLRKSKGDKGVRKTSIFKKTGTQNISQHTMNMPKRQFMGDSTTLRKKQIELIKKEINKVWPA